MTVRWYYISNIAWFIQTICENEKEMIKEKNVSYLEIVEAKRRAKWIVTKNYIIIIGRKL